MRAQNFHLNTLKETPADAEIISHQLMLRAGLIRQLGSGLYSWLPLGLRVLRKVENIVRDEMNRAGGLELSMPVVQPSELWKESGRWDDFGPLLLKMTDANDRAYCFGPTHEEVITDIARKELKSYKQLPINFYQIQTKFRDEIRPRFGVMRAREFLMKDAYSFHIDQSCLAQTYQTMYDAYSRIFTRLGLNFRAVEADTGAIGGNQSHEFHVLADSGEDAIACSDSSDYAANVEKAEAIAEGQRDKPSKSMTQIATPGQTTIEAVSQFLKINTKQCIKTLIVQGTDGPVALVLRGDHDLNELKAEKLEQVTMPLTFCDEQQTYKATKAHPGSIGPVGLEIPVIIDQAAALLADFVCGANQDGHHLQGVNWGRDTKESQVADIRKVVAGDPSPDGKGKLNIVRGIEVGHVFQLGDKYSTSMQAGVLDKNGRSVFMQMGCYGIGVSRIVAAAIEQNHDANGIIWPLALCPFQIALVPVNMAKSALVRETAETLYKKLSDIGYEVLLEDRPIRPGVSFADMELIGIPHRIVVSEKSLAQQQVEYRGRRDSDSSLLPLNDLESFLRDKFAD